MKLLPLVVMLALPSAGYSQPSSPQLWPEENQKRFLASCSNLLAEALPDREVRQTACRCALDTLERSLPWAEVEAKRVSMDRAVEAADEAFRECITGEGSQEI